MTTTNDKFRSLFLATLMIFSVLAMTVAISGSTAAADTEASITSAVEYNDGELEVVLDQNWDGSETIEVLSPSGQAGRYSPASSGGQRTTVSLSGDVTPNQNLSVRVLDGNGNVIDTAIDIDTTATAVAENGSSQAVYHGESIAIVSDEDNEEVRIEGGGKTIRSSTGSNSQVFVFDTDDLETGETYDVGFRGSSTDTVNFTVSSLGLNATTVNEITTDDDVEADFRSNADGKAVAEVIDSKDDVVASRVVNLQGGQTVTENFGTLDDTGNYTVEITDNNTGVTASTDTIEASQTAPSNVVFNQRVVDDHVGDVVSIPIGFKTTDTASVVIGSPDQNYWINATVEDGNGDGEVVVEFNSYTAGTNADGNTVLSLEDGDDDLSVDDEGGAFTNNRDDLSEELLESVKYDMFLVPGEGNYDPDDAETIGRLSLRDRSTDSMTVNTSPGFGDINSDNVDAALGENVTEATEIANGDVVVHQIEATGLEGVLTTQGDNVVDALLNSDNVTLAIEHTNPGVHTPAVDLTGDLDQDNVSVVSDFDNDVYYVAIETDQPLVENHHEYETNFTVNGDSPLAPDGTESVYGHFTVVETESQLHENEDGLVFVEDFRQQNVTGTANLAPGTEVTVRIESDDPTNPFLTRPTATVQPDGTFTLNADFSKLDPGTNLTFTMPDGDTHDGVAVHSDPVHDSTETATPTAEPDTDTPTPTPTVTPDDETPTPNETPTPDDETGPGFTAVAAIGALVAAALLAVRRDD